MQKEISSALFVRAIKSGYANLENSKNEVNNLNVFPVPDGDTGTNMALTMQNAKEELLKQTPATVGECAVNASTGALMGARGNSGVILSQLFRGFSKSLAGKDVITVEALANALLAASNMAYKAVMKPTEGTILTVARVMGEFASENYSKYEDIVSFGEDILKAGNEALADTPNLLPVLKQAGVVDAGGKGLLCILEGALKAIKGEDVELSGVTTETEGSVEAGDIDAEITFAYCTEFLIRAKDDGDYERWLTEKLFKLGDCLIVIQDGKIIKVHVHTNEPWTAMKHASQCGELEKIKIENMRRQHSEMFGESKSPEEPKTEEYNTEHVKYATIAVCAGDGFEEILRQLGVDYIIKGGQTMNPSTEDFLKIINNTDAEHYILLPNNKNIIMAASQTKSISDKDITVIETKNLPQAISAMISFDVEAELEDNVEAMNEAKGSVKTGQVTFAVRNTNVDGFEISEGDIIGVLSDEIVVCEKDVKTAMIGLIDKMVDEDSELISVYYGEDVTEEEAQALVEELAEKYEDCDIELSEGSQPLYYYIIGVE